MKLSDVVNEDMQACGDLLHIMQRASLTMPGSDVGKAHRAFAWLQNLAKDMMYANANADTIKNVKITLPPPKVAKAKK